MCVWHFSILLIFLKILFLILLFWRFLVGASPCFHVSKWSSLPSKGYMPAYLLMIVNAFPWQHILWRHIAQQLLSFLVLTTMFNIFKVQLTVTPREEGILKIIGVRWKLSGSVVGFYNFGSNLVKKKVAKGRRKAKHSPPNDLKFIVIKVQAASSPSNT